MPRPCTTARDRATTRVGAWIVGTTTVPPTAEWPDCDVTRHAVSRVKRNGSDQVSSAAAVALPRRTQRSDPAGVPAGAVQTVTTSPGAAVPLSALCACQALRAGPVTVGGKVGSTVTLPVAAGP